MDEKPHISYRLVFRLRHKPVVTLGQVNRYGKEAVGDGLPQGGFEFDVFY